MTIPIKQNITYFGRTNFREEHNLFGIYQSDRLLHTYIIGKTGTGKSSLLKTKILQDIYFNRGLCLLDPHGDLASSIYSEIPEEKKKDVVYLDIADTSLPYGYNPLKKVSREKQSLVVSGILEIFHKLWGDKAWGARIENIMRYILFTLLSQENPSMRDIITILHDEEFRRLCILNVQDEDIRKFWYGEFKSYTKNDFTAIYNKVGAFLSHKAIKRFVIENMHQISLRKMMDEGKVLLVNISKGKLGSDASDVLGSLFLNSIALSAFSRIDTPEEQRKSFFVYLDEFQNFTTESIANMLSELRKFRLGLSSVISISHNFRQRLEMLF